MHSRTKQVKKEKETIGNSEDCGALANSCPF